MKPYDSDNVERGVKHQIICELMRTSHECPQQIISLGDKTYTVITLSIGTDRPLQMMQTQIRCHRMWHLIIVYTARHAYNNDLVLAQWLSGRGSTL